LFLTFWILLPAAISLFIYFNHEEKGSEVEVIVVQPNIDPYEEKFSGSAKFIPYEQQLERLISLSEKMIGPETRYVAWPETALPYGYLEDEIEEYAVINQLKSFVEKHKNISLITGLDTYKLYKTKETSSCVYKKSYGVYEDSYNSALYINEKKEIDLYRKSRLVPGVEYMPPSLTEFAIEMGESAGGLGKQDTRTVFFNKDSIGIAPVICYESVFGEFVTDYIKNGANMIFIITNDGWWGNTEGHKQHLLFASLRAIETRKSIARAANTGISGFINQRGDIIARSGYWEQDVLKMKIRQNDEKTFYTMHGDYIAVIVNFGSVLMLIFTLTGYIRKLKRTRGS
jgi:apolipoprotein N-acyltransferase